MHHPLEPDPPSQKTSPARQKFIQRIATLPIKPAARDYYIRWAESWTKARGHQSLERTQAYFEALGRSTHLTDWQFRQAVDATRILACDILSLPWAASFDWRALSDQAHSLEPNHRTLARETIPVSWESNKVAGASPLQAVTGASRSGDPEAELDSIINSLRREIRLKNYSPATEEPSGARWTGAQRRARRVAAGAAIKPTSIGTPASSASASTNSASPHKPSAHPPSPLTSISSP